MKQFKIGDKVKIVDGSYMTTKIKGKYKHFIDGQIPVGLNKCVFEVMSKRKTPMMMSLAEIRLEFDEEPFNNMVVRNTTTGDIWNGRDDVNFEHIVEENVYPGLYYNVVSKYHAYLFSEGVGYVIPKDTNSSIIKSFEGVLIEAFDMDYMEPSHSKLTYKIE